MDLRMITSSYWCNFLHVPVFFFSAFYGIKREDYLLSIGGGLLQGCEGG